MSSFSLAYLAKLQDLKIWQNQIKQTSDPDTSNCETNRSVSELGSPKKRSPRIQPVDWDKKAISSIRPFEQLLEEKLVEEEPLNTQTKPKKPFLKKGSGLARYKLSQKPASTKRNQPTKSTCKNVSSTSRSNAKHFKVDTKIVPELGRNALLKESNIKSKATWCDISTHGKNTGIDSSSRKENQWESKQKLEDMIEKIHGFSSKPILPTKNSVKRGLFNTKVDIEEIQQGNNVPSTKTIFENTVEKELKIFEALEERVEHSSFSSTNSSIVRLLSSTPNTLKSPVSVTSPRIKKRILLEKSPCRQISASVENNEFSNNLRLKENINEEHILHDFLNNLKLFIKNKDIQVEHGKLTEQEYSPYSSLSEHENWTEPDNFSQSSVSIYTDVENTIRNNKVDAAVNTTFNETIDQIVQISSDCQNCEQLKAQLNKLLDEIPDIQAEKATVCDFAKDLEAKRDQLTKEIETLKKKYEEDLNDLRIELESEKKKYIREKSVFDMYIRDSRPTKKDREETINLKKELADIKEVVKLKETKNGATQARLRNQIKYLEKERDELKTIVENLQKENAKLNALKKVTKPKQKTSHASNTNLNKLSAESLKNQLLPDTSSTSLISKEPRKSFNNLDEECCNYEHKSDNKTMSEDQSGLEKQYEDTFGQFGNHFKNSEKQNGSLEDSKRERIEKIFPDGSKEIKYSNGNTKTVSPDGNLIIIQYYNGDIKEINLLHRTLKYFYAENSTWHTQFEDGSELLEYANGQKERNYQDGKKEVICSDGTILTGLPDGSEEILYPDGSKMIRNTNGEKILLLPNGQKEIHTNEHQRREYPDGTVRILYLDGTQETRYPSGRVRIKDANGTLLMDSESA